MTDFAKLQVETEADLKALLATNVKNWAEGAVAEHGQSFIDLMRVELNEWERRLRGPVVTSYTVAAEANAALDAQELLVRADEIKTWLDDTVKVGTHEGRTMVFNKRDAANKIARIINDRFNARRK